MPGIYNRETLFLKQIVEGRRELDMASIDFPTLDRSKSYAWTFVRRDEQCRPDLLAYRIYRNADLWWFVMWINGIMDPWHDLMPDVAIKYIPVEQIDNAFKYIRLKRAK